MRRRLMVGFAGLVLLVVSGCSASPAYDDAAACDEVTAIIEQMNDALADRSPGSDSLDALDEIRELARSFDDLPASPEFRDAASDLGDEWLDLADVLEESIRTGDFSEVDAAQDSLDEPFQAVFEACG